MAVAVVAGVFALSRSESRRDTSIAILPFANRTGDTAQTYLSDGLAEDLTASLARIPELRVVPHGTVRTYRDDARPPEVLAAELAVTYLLTGELSRRGDSMRISVELVDTKRRKRQWGDVRVVPKRDLAMTMDSMVRAITVSLLPGALGARAWQAPVLRDSLAYNYYLLAQHHYNRFTPTELARSIAYYDSVLARDPAFVGAWIGRANVLMAMASGNGRLTGREALVPLRRALDTIMVLDPRSAIAHALRGHAYTWFEWDGDAAAREFARALALAPRDPTVLMRANFQQVAEGHTDSSLALIAVARQLEPTNLRPVTASASASFFGRRYTDCLRWARQGLELEPGYPPGLQFEALCLSALGRHAEAIMRARQAVTGTRQLLLLSTLAIVLAQADSTVAARALIGEIETSSAEPSFDTGLLFRPYAALNDRDRFFSLLERAIADRSYQVSVLPVDPVVDPVRADARFGRMLTRVGLPSRAR